MDAAFDGLVLPFLKELGYEPLDFDFSLSSVYSIAIDPPKMGLAPIPAGGILFSDASMSEAVSVKVPYLDGGEMEQSTLLGTTSGASAVAVWALLRYLGRAGYVAVVDRCLRLAWKLVEGIQRIDGLDIVIEPTLNVVGVKSDQIDVRLIFQELRKRSWAIFLFLDYLPIIVKLRTKQSHIRNFLEDLQRIADNLKT